MDQKSSTSIKVAIRIRPLIALENENQLRPQWGTQQNVIYQTDDSGQKFGEAYSFDHIFGMDKTNSEIYSEIVQDFVTSSLDGLNSTIFAYGQTSSGKTYTMLGHKKDAGIMSLAIENIFKSIENNITRKFLLRVSYIEIYNEKINDLLDPNNKDMKIRELFPSGVGLPNVKEELVSTKEEMYNCLKVGNLHRHIGSTKANERSSRSHTIFKITIESTQCSLDSSSGSVQVSSLNLVDLAGSERVAQTKATGMRLKEGGHINKSLTTLSLVIRQLSENKDFVNFRDSKLTRLLQDSLGGNSKTLIIATITVASLEHTASTLAFAQRAKTVKNKPQVNEILTDADVSKRYAALNTQLKKKLEEQMLINQKLQKTQDENNREVERLQHQMDMLRDFQGKHTVALNSVPKRRHTIGFPGQKQQFNLKSSLMDSFGHCYENLEDFSHLSDITVNTKDSQSSMNLLETILEEDLTTPISNGRRTKSSTDSFIKKPLSAFEEDDELPVFRSNEDSDETTTKVAELERQLEKAQRDLLEKEDEWNSRERELCNRISELEEELQNGNAKNCSVFDSVPFDCEEVMDQLICLQDVLTNPDFMNNTQEIKQEDSVLQIIEKFNAKVKTSKDIIENEILKQINNFYNRQQEQINVPNELASFNELLNELASFENIPVDLINNMKKESVKDFNILIKVYESLLRKNDLIKMCSEKIKILEDDQRQRNSFQEERQSLKIEINKLITECERKSISQFELEERCIIKEEEMDNLRKKLSNVLGKSDSAKSDENDDLQSQIKNLISEIDEKNILISALEESCTKLKQDLGSLRLDYGIILEENKSLRLTSEELKCENEDHCQKIEILQSKIDLLNCEIDGKNILISTREADCASLKGEAEKSKRKCSNLLEENRSLKREIKSLSMDKHKKIAEKENISEVADRLIDQKIGHYKSKIDVLISEIHEKDALISGLETSSVNYKQEIESLKAECCDALEENESLRCELENVKKIAENQDVNTLEIERLKNDLERVGLVNGEYRQRIDELISEKNIPMPGGESSEQEMENQSTEVEVPAEEIDSFKSRIDELASEIKEKDILISSLETSSVRSEQEVDAIKLECRSIFEENASLKSKLETENQNTNEALAENARLRDDLEQLKLCNEECCHKIERLQSEIDALISEKDTLRFAVDNGGEDFEQEMENLKRDYSTKVDRLTLEIDGLKSKIVELASEVDEKNLLISSLEAGSVRSEQEADDFKLERCKILEENESLKGELEDKKIEIEKKIQEIGSLNEAVSESVRLKDDLEKVRLVSEEYVQKMDGLQSTIDALTSENNNLRSVLDNGGENFEQEMEILKQDYSTKIDILTLEIDSLKSKIVDLISEVDEKNLLISSLEAGCVRSDQEMHNFKLERCKILEENESLKCELEDKKVEIQKKIQEIGSLNEAVSESVRLKDDLEKVRLVSEEYVQKMDSLQSRIDALASENDHLRSVSDDLGENFKREIENLKRNHSIKIEALTEEYRQKIDNLNYKLSELASEIDEKNILISSLEASSAAFRQETDNLRLENRNISKENKSLRCELEDTKIEIEKKNAEIRNIEEAEKAEFCNQEIENLRSEVDALILEKNTLRSTLDNNFKEEMEILKKDYCTKLDALTQDHRQKLDGLNSKIDGLTSEIDEKNIIISSLEASCNRSKQETDNFKLEFHNISEENQSLKCHLESIKAEIEKKIAENQNLNEAVLESKRLRDDLELRIEKIDGLQSQIVALTSDLNEKSILLSSLETSSVKSNREMDNLKLEYGNILEENKSLRRELENTKTEIETRITENQNINKVVLENRRLKNDLGKAELESEKYRQKIHDLQSRIDALASEIEDKDILISTLEAGSQEIDRLRLENRDILETNQSLKRQLETIRTEIETKIAENRKMNEAVAENRRLKDDLERVELSDEENRRRLNELQSEIDALTCEKNRKNTLLSAVGNNGENYEHKMEILKRDYSEKIDVLKAQINEKSNLISELETVCVRCKQKSAQSSPEGLIVQRHKQLYKSAQAQINELKLKLADQDKLKRTLSQYKIQVFTNTQKIEEYRQLNEKLQLELYQSKNNEVDSGGCDETSSFRSSCKQQEISVNELVSRKDKIELVLCSIIESFISEQKTLLSARLSQDQRDRFKNILRDVKATNANLKHHLSLLRNHDRCDFDEITESLLKSRCAIQEYSSTEKGLMQEQIRQLDCSNEKYLQEIIALKNQTECPYCDSLKKELMKAKESIAEREQTLGSLKSRNEVLEKEHMERMAQITNLQVQLYSEQDRKAEVQYTDYLKFLQDNNKAQQQQIQKLERKNEEYRKMAAQNIQSNEEETRKERNYSSIKGKYMKSQQEIALLSSQISKLKDTGKWERTPDTNSVEIQCDILSAKKYLQIKTMCANRKKEADALQAEIAALRSRTE